MFRALTELKSDIIIVDKLVETTSTTNYSKSTHRIKNTRMQNISLLLLLYITHLVAYHCSQLQSVACQSKQFNSAVTITDNKMDARNKTIDSKSTGSEAYTSIDVSYNVRCIMVSRGAHHVFSVPVTTTSCCFYDVTCHRSQ